MDQDAADDAAARLRFALKATASSQRLQAALTAGTRPAPEYAAVLIERCAVEPDFFVRDMLTWALTRHDPESVVQRLYPELGSARPQARAQALHTLSKLRHPGSWNRITTELMTDPDERVRRTAWRTAAILVPAGAEAALAQTLTTQLGRGDRETRMSLTRALLALGEPAEPALAVAATAADGAGVHARATSWLLLHPEDDFDAAVERGKR